MKEDKPIKILLVDDHQMIRDGIRSLLTGVDDVDIVAEASNGNEAIEILKKQDVDLILMDISMPEMNGIEATKIITSKFEKVKVLTLSMHDEESFVIKMLQVGASGYVLKTTDKLELTEAIKTVASGESYFTKEASKAIMQYFMKGKSAMNRGKASIDLTKRELEVLVLIAEEFTNLEIAEKLFLSPRTVDTHRRNLLQKLAVKNTAGLVKYAIEQNLIR